MAGNIKLEIIYYGTEPDATLEFGLQGNFAVRILSCRVQTAAELVAALKKATVRNEFIVVVGGFEDQTAVEVIARAIGRALVPAGADAAGIQIPADAIPLLAQDGAVCGAVIESGYQSILLLSGEPSRRELVFKPLVLPYLQERYLEVHSAGAEQAAAPRPEEPAEPAAEAIEPAAPAEAEPEAAAVPAAETIDAEEPAAAEETVPFPPDIPDEPVEPEQPEAEEKWQSFLLPEPEEDSPFSQPKKKRRVWLWLLIVFLSLALVAGSAFSYLFYFVPWQNGRKAAEFSALYAEGTSLLPLCEVNGSTTGWLQMQSAGIETPVVYAAPEEPNYYRYHLLDGTLNPIGTPYVTEPLGQFDGLHMVQMDGYYDALKQYLDADFTKNNRRLQYSSVSFTAEWRVFSAFVFGKEPAFDYLKTKFADAAEYAKQLRILRNASEIGKGVTVADDDTVAVFAASRFGKTVVVAALLVKQTERADTLPTITVPNGEESASSAGSSSAGSSSVGGASSVTSSGTASTGPVLDYTAEDNKVDLVDKVEDDTDLPPLSDAEIEDNLNIPAPPVSSISSRPPVSSGGASSSKPPATSSGGSSSAPPSSGGGAVRITGDKVRVRDAAGTNSKIIGQVNSGETFAYLGSVKDNSGTVWYKIQYSVLEVGYVTSEFSTLTGSGSTSSSTTTSQPVGTNGLVVTVLSNGVNVRAGAGTDYAKLGLVHMGQMFDYISETTVSGYVWYCFQYTADTVGWIRSDYASKSNENNAPTEGNISSGNVTLTVKNGNNVLKGSALDIVASVIEAEMGSGYPLEALKAQAVATYSFLLVRGSAKGTPVVAPMKTPGARCRQAAKEVLGQCAYYSGKIAQTYYYAISAGYTAYCQDIWSATLPYLVAVESAPDKNGKGFASEKSFKSEELKAIFNDAYPDSHLDFDSLAKEKWFACTYDVNNAYCKSILIANKLQLKGNRLYGLLGLRSGAYTITYDAAGDTFTFHVRGHGHGVGMSQVGAKGYANQGWDYKKILQHYYPGVIIK